MHFQGQEISISNASKPPPDRALPAVIVCFLALVALVLCIALTMTGGEFIYALDDAYIHLGIARALLEHQVWGVDGVAFVPASSSLTWPVLLVLTGAGSKHGILMPFVLNLVFALLAIRLAANFLPTQFLGKRGRFVALSLFVLVAPLGLLAFTGMEHILQIVLTLAIVSLAARMISNPNRSASEALQLAALAFLLAATRYEGLFIVAPICAMLLLSRHFVAAILAAIAAWLPLVGFGLYSKANGWFFFPTSVLIKTAQSFHAATEASRSWADYPAIRAFNIVALKFFQQLGATPSVLFFTLAVIIFLNMRRRAGVPWNERDQALALIFLGATFLHMSLGSVDGPAYRYEAYLAAFGFLVLVRQWVLVRGLVPNLDQLIYQPGRIAFCFILLAGPRTIVSNLGMPFGPRGIFEQQIQVARFLKQNYSGSTVAANDVGAVDYLGQVRTLDLFGLTSLQVAQMKLSGTFTSAAIAELARKSQVKLAVVYEKWFVQYGGVPASWVKVAEWSVPFTLVCGTNRLSFYAVNPAEQGRLRDTLSAFRSEMPSWVTVDLS